MPMFISEIRVLRLRKISIQEVLLQLLGFTTVLEMPNTIPATDTQEAFNEKLKDRPKKEFG